MAMACAFRRAASAALLRRRGAAFFCSRAGSIEDADVVSEKQEQQHEEQFAPASQQQYEPPSQEYYTPPPPPPPPPPPKYFDNADVPLTLVIMGRAQQVKFQSQKEFDMLMQNTTSFGVMLPDDPGNITSKLCELDPKKVYVLVDSRAVLKHTKRMAKEEAEREGYPPDFMNMLSRNKYGKYVSDDEDD